MRHPLAILPTFLLACSDYDLEHLSPAAISGEVPGPDLLVEPAFHDFGALGLGETADVEVTLSNLGAAPLRVDALDYATQGTELTLDVDALTNGALPWTLEPGEARQVRVRYVPVDTDVDDGAVVVASDDPDTPVARAEQAGRARPFDGFSTGWYIVEDPAVYATDTDPAHVVDRVGDPDGYWYEPSGVHGLVDSLDSQSDFLALHDWIVAQAGAPTPVTGPLTFVSPSVVPDLEGASFTWILCDFWLDWDEDPARYLISAGPVDDGVRVMVNGVVLGDLEYGQSGSWPLDAAIPGAVNTLVVILQDNAAVERYLYDLAFARDGMIVGG